MICSNNKISLKNLAAMASIGTSAALSLLKAVAFILTGSLSILSSMIDSLADVISSLVTYIAVKISDKPLTDKHRYGYGKAESLSALVQAAFIIGSAGFILYDAIDRFIHPVQVEQTTVGIAIMVISLVLTFALIAFQKYVVRKTNSLAIAADSLHYRVDILSNLSVIFSLFLVRLWQWQWADIVMAILIAIYLLINALLLAYKALGEITDAELDSAIRQKIITIICAVPGVKGYHDFRSRISGARMFVEVHLEMDGALSLNETHEIADTAEKNIIAAFPQAQVIIHQDPYGLAEQRLDHQITPQDK